MELMRGSHRGGGVGASGKMRKQATAASGDSDLTDEADLATSSRGASSSFGSMAPVPAIDAAADLAAAETDPAAASRWPRVDALFQLTNTYYAKRMARVTAASYLSMILLFMFSSSVRWLVVWLLFQVINTLLGISALPWIQLYSVAPMEATAQADKQAKNEAAVSAGASAGTQRQTSFAFLRSAFYSIETKLQPFLLKRSVVLRCCESLIVVQMLLLYLVVVLLIMSVWVGTDSIWESHLFNPENALGALAVYCVYRQTLEFDRLRAHQQLQLGSGFDPDLLRDAIAGHNSRFSGRNSHSSSLESSRLSMSNNTTFLGSDMSTSERGMVAMNSLECFRGSLSNTLQRFANEPTVDLGSISNVVETELRRGLYEAAVDQDHAKALALLDVMERALGTRQKVEMLLLRMYNTPTLWLWSFAISTYNPLHVACRLGDLDMVELLLERGMAANFFDKIAGAPFSLRLLYECCQGRLGNLVNVLGTPLHVAVLHGHTRVIDILVAHDANLDALTRTSIFSYSMRVPAVFLADAADVMECLIRHRANILLVPGKGNSMSVTVLQRVLLQDRRELAVVLEDWGADVALTPLHAAAAAGDVAATLYFLSWGIHPDQFGEYQTGVNKRTPLHWACVMGRRAVVSALIAHGANVNELDSDMRTPLHWAARHNHVDTVEELLDAGADPYIMDEEGFTPLGFAAAGGLLGGDCIKQFVAREVNVNDLMDNKTKDTCLHLALRRDHCSTAVALIEAGGADLASVNGDGIRAVECCASADSQYAVKMSSKWIDVVVSYEPIYRAFAERIKLGIQQHYITVYMRSGREEDAQISKEFLKYASAVVCLLSPGYEQDVNCMEEVTCAKETQVPVVAISLETMKLSETLQVLLFTRQIVPFGHSIVSTSKTAITPHGAFTSASATREISFTIDEEKFTSSMQNLIDGLRDEVELHRLGGDRGLVSVDVGMSSVDTMLHSTRSTRASTTSSPRSVRNSNPLFAKRDSNDSIRSMLVSVRGSLNRVDTFRHLTLNDVVKDIMERNGARTMGLTSVSSGFSVFLSHGDRHKDFVNSVYTELRRQRISVTLDSMANVSSMKERILAAKDAILQSSIFLVVLSKKSVRTDLVSDQLAFAEDKGKFILPIYYTGKPNVVDSKLREMLENEKRMMIFGDDLSYGRGLDELVRDLRTEAERMSLQASGVDDEFLPRPHPLDSPAAQAAARRLLQNARARLTTTKCVV